MVLYFLSKSRVLSDVLLYVKVHKLVIYTYGMYFMLIILHIYASL